MCVVDESDVGVVSEDAIDSNSEEYCAIAFEEASMMCATPELVFVQASKFMGFAPEEIDEMLPLDATYQDVLADGVGESVFEARKWILARAWDVHVNDGKIIFEAFAIAWQEAIYDLS
jgi:hypothetical protein